MWKYPQQNQSKKKGGCENIGNTTIMKMGVQIVNLFLKKHKSIFIFAFKKMWYESGYICIRNMKK
jgi:hypothetical protein